MRPHSTNDVNDDTHNLDTPPNTPPSSPSPHTTHSPTTTPATLSQPQAGCSTKLPSHHPLQTPSVNEPFPPPPPQPPFPNPMMPLPPRYPITSVRIRRLLTPHLQRTSRSRVPNRHRPPTKRTHLEAGFDARERSAQRGKAVVWKGRRWCCWRGIACARGTAVVRRGGDVWEVGGWDGGDEDEEDNITRETRQIITNNR
jgi:hypothetical protein